MTGSVGAARLGAWVLVILALLCAGVYANSLVNGFALDDVAIVQHNDRVTSLEWTRIWTENYWPAHDGESPDILYRPLTVWSYLATQAIAPDAMWAHHLGNVLLHALATVMGAMLAWRILGNRIAAILTGLLFALHPIHTEVVANVVGRAELLSTVFSLAALLVFLPEEPLLQERGPVKRGYWHGWLVAACLMLGMLSKETPVALVGAFVFIDLWRWSHWEKCDRPTLVRWMGRQTWRYYVPLMIAVGAYLAMRINACGLMSNVRNIHFIVNPLVVASPIERVFTPFAILTKYLHVMLWPSVLCADYSYPSFMPVSNPLAPSALIGILLTALACIGMVRLWRKAPQVVLAIALFAFSYALVANVLRIGTIMGERLFYLPSLFVLILVAWAAVRIYGAMEGKISAAQRRWAALGLAGAVCVAMTVRTVIRNTDWHDNIPLAIATARDNPGSAKACYWAGNILALDGPDAKTQAFGAELLQHAIELYPEYGLCYFELAKYEGRSQHLAKSLILLAQASQYSPGVNDIRTALTAIKKDLRDQAVESYMPELREYRAAHPHDPAGEMALGVAYAARGKLPEAEAALTSAIGLQGGHFHEAVCELAQVRFAAGEEDQAIALLKQYVDHVRINLDSRCMLAGALLHEDPKKYPHSLEMAQFYLDQAEVISNGNPHVRELRAELSKKRAALNGLRPLAGEEPARSVSMGLAGGGQ